MGSFSKYSSSLELPRQMSVWFTKPPELMLPMTGSRAPRNHGLQPIGQRVPLKCKRALCKSRAVGISHPGSFLQPLPACSGSARLNTHTHTHHFPFSHSCAHTPCKTPHTCAYYLTPMYPMLLCRHLTCTLIFTLKYSFVPTHFTLASHSCLCEADSYTLQIHIPHTFTHLHIHVTPTCTPIPTHLYAPTPHTRIYLIHPPSHSHTRSAQVARLRILLLWKQSGCHMMPSCQSATPSQQSPAPVCHNGYKDLLPLRSLGTWKDWDPSISQVRKLRPEGIL